MELYNALNTIEYDKILRRVVLKSVKI
jgi:hypothetical protein